LKPRINIGIVFSKTWSLVKDALSTSWDAGQVPNIHEETELEHGPIYPVFADIILYKTKSLMNLIVLYTSK
jgi:hypothetical protein